MMQTATPSKKKKPVQYDAEGNPIKKRRKSRQQKAEKNRKKSKIRKIKNPLKAPKLRRQVIMEPKLKLQIN